MSPETSGKHPHSHQHSHSHAREQMHGPAHSASEARQDEAAGAVSEHARLEKMIEHWIEHNLEHARSFEDWAGRADALGAIETAATLRRAAADMTRINLTLTQALRSIPAH